MLAKAAIEVKSEQSFYDKMRENAANERVDGLKRQISMGQQLHLAECDKLRAAVAAHRRPLATTPAVMSTKEKSIELPRTPGPGAVRPPLTAKPFDRPLSARTLQLRDESQRRMASRGASSPRSVGAPRGPADSPLSSRGRAPLPAAMPPF